MQRLAAQNFFAWSCRGSAPAAATPTPALALVVAARLGEQLAPLTVMALLRPLRGLASTLSGVKARPARTSKVAELPDNSPVALLLAACGTPDRHLEFALALHTDQAAAQYLAACVEEALGALCPKDGQPGQESPLEAALVQWHSGWETVLASCREAFELHQYLVLLDVKGDRALAELSVRRLATLSGCSPRGLANRLRRTGPWVEEALRIFAAAGDCEQLALHHAEALRQWCTSWEARVEQQPLSEHVRQRFSDGEHGQRCWERYFNHLFKVSWADFLEAFEDFYLLGSCPLDLRDQLRRRLDPHLAHHVPLAKWLHLVREHGRIADIMQALLRDASVCVPRAIYRDEPLASIERPRPSPARSPTPSRLSEKRGSGASPTAVAEALRMQHGPSSSNLANEEADSAALTPQDLKCRCEHAAERTRPLAWDEYEQRFCRRSGPWWKEAGAELDEETDSLLAAALRAVQSSLAYTRKALVMRVVSGDLAAGRPPLMPLTLNATEALFLPAVVITANGQRLNGTTKFGRGSSRQTLQSDMQMGEPIASSSHFNVVYDQGTSHYSLVDAGSKSGTFVKIRRAAITCGDWIRIGNTELIVRNCGGGCSHKRHARRVPTQSLRVMRDHVPASPAAPWGWLAQANRGQHHTPQRDGADDSGEESMLMQDELLSMVGGVRPRAWPSASARWGCEAALAGGTAEQEPPLEDGSVATPSTARRGKSRASARRLPPSLAPIVPLELDVTSGPRMGERLLITERVCTLGRGDTCNIQVSDPVLANISRIHCIFEYSGNRWHVWDNASANGTWRRLSCVLSPSAPMPLTGGESILAGVHEFLVEQAEMTRLWLPSATSSVLEDMCEGQTPQGRIRFSGRAALPAANGACECGAAWVWS